MPGGRVLLVDDDPNVLAGLRRQLGHRFDVTTAESGGQAVELVTAAQTAGAPFAVMVCDMHMPGQTGIETVELVRAVSPDTSCIMLTGDADQKTAIAAINRGHIFRFYAKPCAAEQVGEGIAAGLEHFQLHAAERRLAENEERWRLALEAVGDGAWDWDPGSGRMIFSEGWRRMLGAMAEPIAPHESEWWDRIHPDDAARVAFDIDRLLRAEKSPLSSEHRLRLADGGYGWFLARGAVLYHGPDGWPTRVIGTHADISERKRMEEALARQADELRLLATTDALTGLWNRRRFLEQADEELARARRYGRPLSLVMIDIDFFKRVNDSFGHDGGDAVLRWFSDCLRRCLRKTDFLGRLGGEEFSALLPETDADGAVLVAETLREAVAAQPAMLPDGRTIPVTASFGVSQTTESGRDKVSDVLCRADEALYAAKHGGRNRVCRFSG